MPCNSGTWQRNVKANTLFRKVLRFSKKKGRMVAKLDPGKPRRVR